MLKALVVDDNEVNTMILANILELFDICTDQTNQGMKAVIMSEKTSYDIIFIDHIMPEMDGVQTTATIRDISLNKQKSIIIALTSNITENVRRLFQEAGANDVYAKPLGLIELISLLKQWCPEVSVDSVPIINEIPVSNKKNDFIKTIIEEVDDINYSTGLKYAIGNPIHYIDILEVSLKDLLSCYNIIIYNREKNSMNEVRIGVHNLKSVFANIGAMELAEEARYLEMIILQEDIHNINLQCIYFINHLEHFIKKLQIALDKYNVLIQSEKKEQELVYIPMSKEEYEQCLLNTIYYIRRFEYDSIIKEMESLILRGRSDFKEEFELALMDIKDFSYEKALTRLINIKNEIGN